MSTIPVIESHIADVFEIVSKFRIGAQRREDYIFASLFKQP